MKKSLSIIFFIIFVQICKAMDSKKNYSPNELKEDLNYLFQKIENVHPNPYEYTSLKIICEKRKYIESSITQAITKLEIWRIVAPLLSTLQCNHIYLYFLNSEIKKYNKKGGKFFPLNIFIINNELYIKEKTAKKLENISGKLLSINLQSTQQILEKMHNLVGFGKSSEIIISENFAYYLWLICGISNNFKIKYISKNDKQEHFFTHAGISLNELNKSIDKPKFFNYYNITNKQIGIVQIKTFAHEKKEEFKSFLFDTFKKIRKDKIKDLIIDIRKNGGGSDYNGRLLFNYINDKPYMQLKRTERKSSKEYRKLHKWVHNIKWYNILFHPKYIGMLFEKNGSIICETKKIVKPDNNDFLYKGNIYLLISSRTSSAAMDFAAAFKHYKMGTIIGKETEGSLVEYSNCVPFTLPKTKLEGVIASQKAICVGAKDDGHGVIPDYEVIPSIDDVYNGTDRVMEFTKEFIEKRRKSNNN